MKLRSLFAGLGACVMLTMSAMTSATIITIDNTDAGFTSSGMWSSSRVSGFVGTDYLADTVNSAGDFANWNPTASLDWVAGLWQVEMLWTGGNGRTTAGLVTIDSGSTTSSLFVNQTLNGGVWNDLGSYNFAEIGASITLDDSNSLRGQYIIADAVRFTLVQAAANSVPAPGTFAMLLLAGAGLLSTRRKYK